MKTNLQIARKGFTLVELLVVISIIVVLAGIATPAAMKALNKAALVEGTNNVRNIKQGLDLFADDMNDEYPNDDTAEEIRELLDDSEAGGSRGRARLDSSSGLDRRGGVGSRGRSGSSKTANSYFEQALARRAIDSDEMFYHTNFKKAFKTGLRQPNNDRKLEAGENVWGYNMGLLRTSSSYQPLVFDTPIETGESPKFAKKVWDGKIVVAYLDGSVKNENIGGTDTKAGPVRGNIEGEKMNIFSEDALEGILVPAEMRRSGGN
ncbi:MAG: type II secretion system protein [Verrucomicrobiota bacterium JB023]|nr:type II secretion system protein [Verrucomicrobiota bacterium JB023]